MLRLIIDARPETSPSSAPASPGQPGNALTIGLLDYVEEPSRPQPAPIGTSFDSPKPESTQSNLLFQPELANNPFAHRKTADLEDIPIKTEKKPVEKPAEKADTELFYAQSRSLHKSVRYAGFWLRFAAVMLDGLLGGGVVLLMARTIEPNLAFVLIIGLFSGFHIGFAALFGATPGKMLLNLRIVTEEGKKTNTLTGVSRFCVQVIHFPFLGLGYLLIPFSPEKRALHDMICRTRVIYSKL